MDEPTVLSPGARLADGYHVLTHLRRSAVMDLYQAWSDAMGTRVVAKRLRPDRLGQEQHRLLTWEGRLLLALVHPHIVRAYELTTADGDTADPVLIVETLMGRTLLDVLTAGEGRSPWQVLCLLGVQATSAIRYLHAQGVIHMDITPGNLMVDQGQIKLIDLNLSRTVGAPGGVGTPAYRSPESVENAAAAAPADVWGIGCVLWEMAAGRPLFDPTDNDPTPQLRGRAPTIRRHRRLPPALAAIIDACLEPDSARRPSVEEVHDVLAHLVGEPLMGTGQGSAPLR